MIWKSYFVNKLDADKYHVRSNIATVRDGMGFWPGPRVLRH